MCLEPEDLLHIEADEILRQASYEMLELAVRNEIDLQLLARREFEYRQQRRRESNPIHQFVAAFANRA